ncbi:MFS transporter [Kaistia sp. MMO-174]|uniref:MFS transporter n=1 Tax=Kaistia sp. MMO-174 TaxID=3081256 RepID=UPI00301B2A47
MLRSLIWLALGTFAIGTEGFMIAGILPMIAGDLQVSVAAAGHLVTCFALVYAVAAPLLAVATANWPRKTLLAAAITAFGLANIVAGLAPDYLWLMVSRVLLALSAAAFVPSASGTAATMVAPEKRGRAISIIYTGMTVSIIVGVPIGTLVAEHFGWRATFLGVAGLAAIALVGILAALPRVGAPASVSLAARIEMVRRPDLLIVLALTFLTLGGIFAINTYFGALMTEIFGATPEMVAGALFLAGIGGAAGNLIGGYAADRWNGRRFLTAVLATLTINFAALSLVSVFAPNRHGLVVAYVIAAVWGLAGWSFPAVQQVRLVRLAPSLAAVSLSLNSSALYFGTAAGAAIGALAIDFVSITAIGWTAALFELAALVLMLATMKAPARQAEPSPCPAAERA